MCVWPFVGACLCARNCSQTCVDGAGLANTDERAAVHDVQVECNETVSVQQQRDLVRLGKQIDVRCKRSTAVTAWRAIRRQLAQD